jgi:Putative peptidase family
MRNRTVPVLLVMIAVLGPGLAPALAAERRVFRYGDGAAGGALINDYSTRWVEFVGSDEKYLFEETGRSDDTIELIDRARDVGLKVHTTDGELRLPNSTVWQPWQKGKWIGLDELPSSIRFVPADQKIRLAYFVPKDRSPIPHYEQKIRVVMQVVADVYKDLLQQGYRGAGLSLQANSQGEPIVQLIRGDKPAQYYNDAPAYDESKQFLKIAGEIPAEVGSPQRHMIIVFPETYEPGPAPVEWRGSVGRGAHISTDGGLAIMSAWILRDEFCATSYDEQKKLILDAKPILGRTSFGTRQRNAPRFEFIEDGFGATAHELGHALGLPHDVRAANDIMGQGFRELRVNYLPASAKKARLTFSKDNARLLGVSRYLVPETDRADNSPPTAEIKFDFLNGRSPSVTVSMQATDDRELRAAVFYDRQDDTVIGGTELKGKSQAIELELPVNTNTAVGRRVVTILARALKDGAKDGPAGSRGAINLVTFLADAGGNIAIITTPVRAR